MNKKKPYLMLQRVSLAKNFASVFKGHTGIIKSTYENGLLGVHLDGREHIIYFKESELYFADHQMGYNQKCFR